MSAPILCGILLGFFNGLAYTVLRIPSLIVTVGLSLIYESFSVFAANWAGTRLDAQYNMFGAYPWNVILALIAFFICGFILKYTKVGTYINAIGTNELTAKNMGVNVRQVQVHRVHPLRGLRGHHGRPLHQLRHRPDADDRHALPVAELHPAHGCVPLALRSRSTGTPSSPSSIGELIISMLFAGFVALGMPTTINNVVTGATLLAVVTLTVKRVKGAVVK